jgi:hypothetical protein
MARAFVGRCVWMMVDFNGGGLGLNVALLLELDGSVAADF